MKTLQTTWDINKSPAFNYNPDKICGDSGRIYIPTEKKVPDWARCCGNGWQGNN